MKSSWMLVAAALFALMSVLVKHAAATFSPAELVFYRSAFGLVAIWTVIAVSHRRVLAPLATPYFKAHFSRGLAGFAALVLRCPHCGSARRESSGQPSLAFAVLGGAVFQPAAQTTTK